MKKTSIKKEQARLFQNPILEYFTKTSLLESTLTSVGIALVCIWIGNKLNPDMSLNWSIGLFVAGLLFWSPFEYLLHRYIFHIAEDAFKGSRRLQYLLHGVHHDNPTDAQRTLMPFLPKIIYAVVFFVLFYIILGKNSPHFSGGFMMGYYGYSMIHYSIHRFRAPNWLKPLWHHHHIHHHLHNDKAYGVSSTFWDRFFKTMPPESSLKSKEVKG